MYICTYVCMYVRMYVCMYVYAHSFILYVFSMFFRQRLSEGFHISSCEGGMITMVLQLPVMQDACSIPHYVLLQYVLFLNIEERRDSTVLASEVWMERQHGDVVGLPKRLAEDSRTLQVKDVADKVSGDTRGRGRGRGRGEHVV